jgi:uncharacterized protein (TIGR00369 family)
MHRLSHGEKVRAIEAISRQIPHARLLGICLERIDGEELTMKMPYRDELVGNPETGAIHGGALTVLLDQTLGIASVCCDQVGPMLTPTLDLRIDHLGVAPAGRDIFAVGRVYRVTRRIVFVEGFAYCEARERPIARATGSWVLMTEVDTRTLFPAHSPETPA